MQRVTIRFEGRVQGVGFRMHVADVARNFAVTGRVCNVADGSVELVAEGEAEVLTDFHQAIRERMSRNIVSERVAWAEVAGSQWRDFGIAADKLV